MELHMRGVSIRWSEIWRKISIETPSLSLFFSSLVCIHLGYLSTDISGIDQALSFHLTHISLSFTVWPIFMLFDL